MVQLELARRFPPGADLDTAWQEGITAFQARMTTHHSIDHAASPPIASPSPGS
jgi:hypothetical protein